MCGGLFLFFCSSSEALYHDTLHSSPDFVALAVSIQRLNWVGQRWPTQGEMQKGRGGSICMALTSPHPKTGSGICGPLRLLKTQMQIQKNHFRLFLAGLQFGSVLPPVARMIMDVASPLIYLFLRRLDGEERAVAVFTLRQNSFVAAGFDGRRTRTVSAELQNCTIFKTADVTYQLLKSKQTVQEQTGLIPTALSV